MYAERAKAVASEGRATRGTEAGADISGWRQSDEMAAARRDGGRVKRSRRFCYLAKSPTLLTPSEATAFARSAYITDIIFFMLCAIPTVANSVLVKILPPQQGVLLVPYAGCLQGCPSGGRCHRTS